MLKSLTIRNFQKHKKLEIGFDKRVTTITGSNSAGKSAILRALWWVCTNKPTGKSFIRHGTKTTCVDLQLGRHSIVRRRGTRNSYSLDGSAYKAFGGRVPETISSLLNINSLNYQCQLEPHLWFHLSSGQIAKELNSILDFSIIDSSQSKIASTVRENKAIVKVSQQRLKDARIAQRKLTHIPKLNKRLEKLESLAERMSELENQENEITSILERMQELDQQLKSENRIKLSLKSALEVGGILESTSLKLNDLEDSLDRIETLDRQIAVIELDRYGVQQCLEQVLICPACGKKLR
jgi:DNA repair ATPase RecN